MVLILGTFGFVGFVRAQSDDSIAQNPPAQHQVSHPAKHKSKLKKRKKKKSYTKIRVDNQSSQEQENVSNQTSVSDQADSKGSKKGR